MEIDHPLIPCGSRDKIHGFPAVRKGITHKTTKKRGFRGSDHGSNQQNALRVIARTNQQKRNDIGKLDN